jgi:hypothetical protein
VKGNVLFERFCCARTLRILVVFWCTSTPILSASHLGSENIDIQSIDNLRIDLALSLARHMMWMRSFVPLGLLLSSLVQARPQWTDTASTSSAQPSTCSETSSNVGSQGDGTDTATSTGHLYNLTQYFFDNMMAPKNLEQLPGLASKLFAEDVTGRVSDSRKFLGRELNTEYVFGGFTGPTINPQRATVLGIPRTHSTMRFAANELDKSAFVTEVVDFELAFLGLTVPVQLDLWFKWNENDEVEAYDSRFVYLPWIMAHAETALQQKMLPNDTAAALIPRNDTTSYGSNVDTMTMLKGALANQICGTAMLKCTGELQQYESQEQCVAYLMKEVRLGQPHEFGVDSVLCRSLHEGMLPLKPEVHCAHVGPSGGGMCADNIDYAAYVADPDFFGAHGVGW